MRWITRLGLFRRVRRCASAIARLSGKGLVISISQVLITTIWRSPEAEDWLCHFFHGGFRFRFFFRNRLTLETTTSTIFQLTKFLLADNESYLYYIKLCEWFLCLQIVHCSMQGSQYSVWSHTHASTHTEQLMHSLDRTHRTCIQLSDCTHYFTIKFNTTEIRN